MKSQRETPRIGAYASSFGMGCHICVPRAWHGRRVMAMLHEEWQELEAQLRGKKGGVDNGN